MNPCVHYHSDCPTFAGCENMLVNFFGDAALRRKYSLSFSYRNSPEYQQGFRERVQVGIDATALRLPDLETHLRGIGARPLRIAARLTAYVLLLKYAYLWFNTRRLEHYFRGRRVDLLHINNGGYPGAPSCSAAALAARRCGITCIVYVVNNIADGRQKFWRWLDGPLDARVTRAVTRFVTGSKFAAERLQGALRIDERKVVNIHNGIRPRALTEEAAAVRGRLGVPVERPLYSVVAVLEPRKGHIVLLRALKQLLALNGSEALPMVVIEGEGSARSALEAYVVATGLGAFVKFAGRERNVFDLMNASDVVLLPSLSHEDFPNVVLEAMSLGKPVIASRVSGIPEQIEDGETGLLVEPGDDRSLALAMQRLLANQPAARSMGAAAQARFNEQFAASVAVQKYDALYSELLGMRSQ